MQNKWFKRKTYGWGWTPATWQGWLVLALFLVLELLNAWRLAHLNYPTEQFVVVYVVETLLLVTVLLVVVYCTGEKPRWQWGRKQ